MKALPPMKYAIIPVTPFQQNCSLVWHEETKVGAVVDPGGEVDRILAAAEKEGVTLEKILLTHGHLDHAGGVAEMVDRLNIPVEGPHPGDQFWIDGMTEQSRMFGVDNGARPFTPTRWLHGGDTVTVAGEVFEVRHCPGHTPGHVIFFHAEDKMAMVGDVLFAGSIGRTDFPGGDFDTLITAIKTQLWPLGEDVTFIPGHGPTSTFGVERKTNSFVRD
jgi:glyoxylase-like metal-dependent hydrolase (beta-lactamase superfamily II)